MCEGSKLPSTFVAMEIEIWSDIACPFCYIGKRQLDQALDSLSLDTSYEIKWRSYQLDPNMETPPEGTTAYEYLAERKGFSLEQSIQAHDHVTRMAENHGLHYDFDKVIMCNTRKALLLVKKAQMSGKGEEVKEALFKAHFIDGINVDDDAALVKIAGAHGIKISDFEADVLKDSPTLAQFEEDLSLAKQIGIRGVPFFVFDRKLAVSGAQGKEALMGAIEKAMSPVY